MTLVYCDACPNWRVVDERLSGLAEEYGFTVEHRKVASVEDAGRLSFRGSPTILVDGRDPFARGDEPVGLSCRVYVTDQGLRGAPSVEQLREALGG